MQPNCLRGRYEDLVVSQDETEAITPDFIGEPFEEACLRFDENRRYARTASYAQVSERLYTGSRYRYKNYLLPLKPVLPIPAPAIERLGYTI